MPVVLNICLQIVPYKFHKYFQNPLAFFDFSLYIYGWFYRHQYQLKDEGGGMKDESFGGGLIWVVCTIIIMIFNEIQTIFAKIRKLEGLKARRLTSPQSPPSKRGSLCEGVYSSYVEK